jgi:hypothetical protein
MSLFNRYLVHLNLNSSFAFAPIHPHSKGLKMNDQFLDYAAALAIALVLCIGLLDYFDVLVK